MIRFNSFSKEYNWLSNFYESSNQIIINPLKTNISFNSVEPAFQSIKLLYLQKPLENEELINLFNYFSTLSKGEAKKSGNKLEINIEKWNSDRCNNMFELVFRKFNNNFELKEKLISTGNSALIEFGTGSNFWGVNKLNIGDNKLGIILQDIREIIKST